MDIDSILKDLEDPKYWDVSLLGQSRRFQKLREFEGAIIKPNYGYLTIRQEYDLDTCHKLIEKITEIIRSFNHIKQKSD